METQDAPEIILGIPGPWGSQRELVEAIARDPNGYAFAGNTLMHVDSGVKFEVEFESHVAELGDVFQHASGGRLTKPELKEINSHKQCAYLIGEGGSAEAALGCVDAANALLRAGGYGVKVESAGVAHSREAWLTLGESADELLEMLVAFVGDEDAVFTCGMHAVGLPDACIDGQPGEEAAQALFVFVNFLLFDSPTLGDGDEFAVDEEGSQMYTMILGPSRFEDTEDPFHNPYGQWTLSPVESD